MPPEIRIRILGPTTEGQKYNADLQVQQVFDVQVVGGEDELEEGRLIDLDKLQVTKQKRGDDRRVRRSPATHVANIASLRENGKTHLCVPCLNLLLRGGLLCCRLALLLLVGHVVRAVL